MMAKNRTILKKIPEFLNSKMIAFCGMNCDLYLGYPINKKHCSGCHGEDAYKPKHCIVYRTMYNRMLWSKRWPPKAKTVIRST
jgi:hypothetical protein